METTTRVEDISVSEIGLSSWAANALQRGQILTVGELMNLSREQLLSIRNIGASAVEEIEDKIEEYKRYLPDEKEEAKAWWGSAFLWEASSTGVNCPATALEALDVPRCRPKIREYVRENDVLLEELPSLTRQIRDGLKLQGYTRLSDIILLGKYSLANAKRVGVYGAGLLLRERNRYLWNHNRQILSFIKGDKTAVYSPESMMRRIALMYKNAGFSGISFEEMFSRLCQYIEKDRMEEILGRMERESILKKKEDGLYYAVYKRFFNCWKDHSPALSQKAQDIVYRRAVLGETLQHIGDSYGITRERIRQIVTGAVKKIRAEYADKTGFFYFEEEALHHLYYTYEMTTEQMRAIGISHEDEAFLLQMEGRKKRLPFQDSLEDGEIDEETKAKIRECLQGGMIQVNGEYVPMTRTAVMTAYAKTSCLERMDLRDFIRSYNAFAAGLTGLSPEEKSHLAIDAAASRTCRNSLPKSRYFLWSSGSTIRYYDIDSRDYNALYNGLALEQYQDTEISTLKLFRDHQDLMEEYDIRDQYELHNLIRKTAAGNKYHEFSCGRMPILRFGNVSRETLIYNEMKENSPIRKKDLVELLSQKYGYGEDTLLSVDLTPFRKYCRNGVYDANVQAPQ